MGAPLSKAGCENVTLIEVFASSRVMPEAFKVAASTCVTAKNEGGGGAARGISYDGKDIVGQP